MATIKAIESRSVHQIQSGQVIVDLNSVVKELVENSLDAGATSIEVRFKNQGLESIEVQDNGKGIAPEDYETVALKHHTSKLTSYEDLTQLDTFGFRGEALSSLCALSNFQVVTARAEDGAVGKKLDFDVSGRLKGTTVQATPKGTTVVVEKLFLNLPVRRKELEKNIKREYGKVLGLLHAYACIGVGVRFSVTNQMPKGKRAPVFSTKLNNTTKENIANVFGAKTFLALLELDLSLEMQPSLGPSTQTARNWTTQSADVSKDVHIQGHISKPVFGQGRQAPDRQLFYVNSRPCNLPQVAKAFNEVYKSFNVSQSPFIFANLVMDTNAYDVNVSPDKRSIMLHDQAALLESLKSALIELFEKTEQTVPQSQLPNRRTSSFKSLSLSRTSTEGSFSREKSETPVEQSSDRAESDDAESLLDDGVFHRPKMPSSNLITNWAQRDTAARSATPSHTHQSLSLPMDESKVGSADRDPEGSDDADVRSLELDKPSDKGPARQTNGLQRRVQDFTALVERGPGADHSDQSSATKHRSSPSSDGEAASTQEPQIPTASSPAYKSTAGPVQTSFDRVRPKRTPLRTAEITIGDTTTTTTIGNMPASKKRRIHEPRDTRTVSKFTSSTLLARGLSRFAAPGTAIESEARGIASNLREEAPDEDQASEADSGEDSEDASEEAKEAKEDVQSPQSNEVTSQDDDVGEDEQHDLAPSSSDPIDKFLPAPSDDDKHDIDYEDEAKKKAREDERVAKLIHEAELVASSPSEANIRRASRMMQTGANRKDSTLQLAQVVRTSLDAIRATQAANQQKQTDGDVLADTSGNRGEVTHDIDDSNAEARLSLTVSKTDFERMRIIGQFNLGFILAVRPGVNDLSDATETPNAAAGGGGGSGRRRDDLFIIDQHAADEKFNYERLQRSTTLQSQRLVHPKRLDLTAVEEEIILNHPAALKANGFEISILSPEDDPKVEDDHEDESLGVYQPSRSQYHLLTLPTTGTKTFDLSDLEELLHLLSEERPADTTPSSGGGGLQDPAIPRPRKIQRLLAMRACRSSIMVGRSLTLKQMRGVVGQMGEMDKPWNCPHGRPTMRHLAGLEAWCGWQEGDAVGLECYDDGGDSDDEKEDGGSVGRRMQTGGKTDWVEWMRKGKKES